MDAPEAIISMTSWQKGATPEVDYLFEMRWGNEGVALTLNPGTYIAAGAVRSYPSRSV